MQLQLKPEHLKKLYLVKTIMEEDCRHHHTHAELCQRIGTNEFLLRHGFKQVYNISLYNFLTQLRIAKAKDLLENSEHPIKRIASNVGFTNSPSFIKMFKKKTGHSPTAWRKLHGLNILTAIPHTSTARPQ
jgi:AraC-like DNA-binding protein